MTPCLAIVQVHLRGHRGFYVRRLVAAARGRSRLLLLTARGDDVVDEELRRYVDDGDLTVVPLDATGSHAHVVDQIVTIARQQQVTRLVVLDGDHYLAALARPTTRLRLTCQTDLVVMRTPPPDARSREGWRALVKATLLVVLRLLYGSRFRAWFLTDSFGVVRKRRGYPTAAPILDPPTWLPHRELSESRNQLGLPPDRRIIGLLGGQTAGKHADLVLEAARLAGWHVLVAGPYSAWADEQVSLSRERGGEVTAFPGHLEDEVLAACLGACDLIGLTYDLDAPSGFIVSAATSGVPVLVGRSPWLREMATELELGVLCDHTVLSIQEALAAFDPESREAREARAARARELLGRPGRAFEDVLLDCLTTSLHDQEPA